MKKLFSILACTALASSLSLPALSQTAGTLTFTFTEASHTASSTYNFNAQHVLAVWIQNSTSSFVKTKLRYVGNGTKDHLPTWAVNAGGTASNATAAACNITDATTGATLSAWTTKTITWDGKNVSGSSNGTIVTDGTYKVTIQSTWNHGTGATVTKSYTFVKGPTSDIQTPANDVNFTGISLQWIPVSVTPPVANFSASNTTICAGQSAAYTDLTTNTPTSWAWTFAGGTPATSAIQNPSVIYSTAGTYTTTLIATNGSGSNTKTQTNYITVNAIPATPSVSSNSPLCLGSTINLNTAAVSGAVYTWTGPSSFTSAAQNPTRASATLAMAGTYSLTTTVNGCTSVAGTTAVVVSGASVTPSVTISITTGSNPGCPGQSVTFTAIPTNGGTTPVYQWNLNGSGVGTNSAAYTNASLTNGDIVTCVMTSNNSCASPASAASNAVTMTIGSVTPSVAISITAGGNPSCPGQSVTFTASPTNGGTTPVYQWKVNGSAVGTNNAAYASASLANGDIVTCVMTSNNSCASPAAATSNAVTMTISSSIAPTVAVALTSGSNPTCSGQSVTFTAAPGNGGTTPSYQWKLNGTSTGSNSPTYTSTSFANGDIITCVMTSNSSCASPSTATSNAVTMTTSGSVTPSVAVAVTSGSNTTCSGQPVTFTAAPTNGGTTPAYQWKLNGSNVGPNSSSYTSSSFTNGDIITCVLTSDNSCASPATATSNSITMTISTALVPTVSTTITIGSNPTCSGQQVTFAASPTDGGTTPSFQWKLNGVNVGSDSSGYTNTAIANGDVITCVLTSSSSCATPSTATSTATTMVVDSASPAAVNITGTTTVCAGAPITLTANPINGGPTPSYQWKLNGVFWGTGDATCTNPSPVTGDIITCIMTSSSSCANPLIAISNLVTVTVNNTPPAPPVISQNNNILTSSSVTGNKWFLNGSEIPGATDQTYVAVQNGSYQVIISDGCFISSSNPVSVTIAGIDDIINLNELTIYPNPNNGNFTVSFSAAERSNYIIEITSVLGQVVFTDELTGFSGTYSKQISVTDYGKGIYTMSILNSKKGIIKKVIAY